MCIMDFVEVATIRKNCTVSGKQTERITLLGLSFKENTSLCFLFTLTFIEIVETNNTLNNNMFLPLRLFHNSLLTSSAE